MPTPVCPLCATRLGFPVDRKVRLTCPECAAHMEWAPDSGFLWYAPADAVSGSADSGAEAGSAKRAGLYNAGATLLWYVFGVMAPLTLAFIGIPEDGFLSQIDSMPEENVSAIAGAAFIVTAGIAWKLGALGSYFVALILGYGAGSEGVPLAGLPVVLFSAAGLMAVIGLLTPLRDQVKIGAFGLTAVGLTLSFLNPQIGMRFPLGVDGLSPASAIEMAQQLRADGQAEAAMDTLATGGITAALGGDIEELERILSQMESGSD